MSAEPVAGALRVEADLVISRGDRQATVTGFGSNLELRTDTPLMFSSLRGTGGLRDLGRFADQLGRSGLRLTVVGPGGRLLTLGEKSSSRIGRWLTGSDTVKLGSLRSLLVLRRRNRRH